MKKIRGFKIGHKFVKIFKWTIRPRRLHSRKLTSIRALARCLSRGAKRLCGRKKNLGQGQIRLGKDPKKSQSIRVVQKGHLVVHIGESDGDTRRVVVPVIYFNHPLFEELLEQTERVLGRITVSDFEKVQMRIAAWDHCRRKRSFKIL